MTAVVQDSQPYPIHSIELPYSRVVEVDQSQALQRASGRLKYSQAVLWKEIPLLSEGELTGYQAWNSIYADPKRGIYESSVQKAIHQGDFYAAEKCS